MYDPVFSPSPIFCLSFSHIIFCHPQAQTARNTTWFTLYEESAPDACVLHIPNLLPFTLYRLRLLAHNVAGSSEPSEPSKEFQTIQAPPGHAPRNVTVRAMSATELRVRWIVSSYILVDLK